MFHIDEVRALLQDSGLTSLQRAAVAAGLTLAPAFAPGQPWDAVGLDLATSPSGPGVTVTLLAGGTAPADPDLAVRVQDALNQALGEDRSAWIGVLSQLGIPDPGGDHDVVVSSQGWALRLQALVGPEVWNRWTVVGDHPMASAPSRSPRP